MSICSSHVDSVYYKTKYNLDLDNNGAIKHYYKYGKNKQYFPNREAELYYCKKINFNPDYYVRKYGLSNNTNVYDALKHWETHGYKNNYYVNMCEELGEHLQFSCKCKIKNNRLNNKLDAIHPSYHNHIHNNIHSPDIDDCIFDTCGSDSLINDNNNNNNNICDLIEISKESNIPPHLNNNQHNIINSSSYSCDLSNCQHTHNNNNNANNINSDTDNTNDNNVCVTSSSSDCKCSDCENINITNDNVNNNNTTQKINTPIDIVDRMVRDNQPKVIRTKGTRIITGDIITNTSDVDNNETTSTEQYNKCTHKKSNNNNNNIHSNECNNVVDVDSISVSIMAQSKCGLSEYIDSKYVTNGDHEEIKVNKNILQRGDVITDDSGDSGISGKSDNSNTNHNIDIRYNIHKVISNNNNNNNNMDHSSTKEYIFRQHMKTVSTNINNIVSYLDRCNIYLDYVTNILKASYKCIITICDPNGKITDYNASRIKLITLLKDIDMTTKTAFYNDLPIFFQKGNKNTKPIKCIKFPLFVCTNNNMNDYLKKTIGDDQIYFKIVLMKASLDDLHLIKYSYPPLNKGDKMTYYTSCIPPNDCPPGITPPNNSNMYDDKSLIKYWQTAYHYKVFEKALYRLSMYKELLNNYHSLISNKKTLYDDINNNYNSNEQ